MIPRPRFNHSLLKYGLILLLAASPQSCKETRSEKTGISRPPNIILVVADDLGYGDLGCYGQKRFTTPEIDGLARDGMRFTQFYAGAPVCAPSRAALMTGLHTGHTGIRGNREVLPEGQYPMEASTQTLAELLKSTGYVTGAFGKWGLGFPGSEGDPNRQGFDEFYGYNCQRIAHNYHPYHLWHNQDKVQLVNNAGSEKGTYGPEVIHKKALEFLEKNKDTTFFLYYPSLIPHAELAAPDRFMSEFANRFGPEKPYDGVDGGEAYKNGGYASQAKPHAAFAAMIALLDEQLGQLRQKVADLGLTGHTLILFTSDNGPHLEGGADPDYFDSNGLLRGYKRDLYEGGIRVPMIACWPGMVAPNSATSHISAFWDVVPTLCELAGIEFPKESDGVSFVPVLMGKPQPKHDYLYWEFHEQGGKQAVRKDNWKVVRLEVNDSDKTRVELYNLETDPSEKTDVASKNPQVLEQMKALMQKAHQPSALFSFSYEKQKEGEK